jgi:hypothetical protein
VMTSIHPVRGGLGGTMGKEGSYLLTRST